MSMRNCPACGSNTVIDKKEYILLKEPYGGQKDLFLKENYCETCGSSGDFYNENENIITNSLEELKIASIRNIIDDFSTNKVSMSAIERAINLPQRTLTKWKNGVSTPSASSTALMKLLRTFPWLLDVAENKYDYNISQKIFLNAAMEKLINSMNFVKEDFAEAGIITTSNSALMYMHLEKNAIEGDELENINTSYGIDNNVQVLINT